MIDWARVAELRDEIGAAEFEEVVPLFLQEVEATVGDLPVLLHSAPETEAALHSLRGSALNLGFSAFAAICDEYEAAARAGATGGIDMTLIAGLYEQSREAFLRDLSDRLAA
ncbi:Hpt domain-containing protein [Salipiger bermudensis]|uniref:Hpt domain-containing protein n=1 Tax=Salipiger bermudensis TaxID=344736 RepID=UPI001C99D7CA|nr:Hpt domain-containing protein [Salipiger bermudensis]MBY6003965.1 Hpt domain-containing protein [Salipiger bermudensis]